MRRFVLTLLALLAFAFASEAGSYNLGTVIQGYTFADDGYWYRGGQRYFHTATWVAGCQYGCNYTPGYYTHVFELYQATPVYQAPSYAPTLPSYTDPGWRSKLLDIAAARDRTEAQIRKSAFDHAQYMEAVQQLGLSGNFRIQGYGAPAPYPLYGIPYTGAQGGYGSVGISSGQYQQQTSYGATGSTQYGYSSVASVYGDSNLASLYQQAAQLTQQAQALGGQANGNFQGLIQQEGGNRARVAEQLARGEAAVRILEALKAGPSTETKTFTFTVGKSGVPEVLPGQPGPPPELRAKLSADYQTVYKEQCASCHNAKTATESKRVDLSLYPSFSQEDKDRVILRITSPDDKDMMPRDPADPSKPGHRLTPAQLRAFLLN